MLVCTDISYTIQKRINKQFLDPIMYAINHNKKFILKQNIEFIPKFYFLNMTSYQKSINLILAIT